MDHREHRRASWQNLNTTMILRRKSTLLKLRNRRASSMASTSTLTSKSNTVPLLDNEKPSQLQGLLGLVVHPISILLVFWPLGILASMRKWSTIWCFSFNFIAMVPLADILGSATEELAAGLKNGTVGGLLSATFGNAVEMILSIQTLRAGMMDVVKAQLLGSILSNLLLVMGMSLVVGGFAQKVWKVQTFSLPAANANMTMLILATASMALPTVFYHTPSVRNFTPEIDGDLTLKVSRISSIYLILCYVAFLFFQLHTHKFVFEDTPEQEPKEDDENKSEEAEATLLPSVAMVLLFITTILVVVSSECLVDSIEGVVTQYDIGEAFIGMILLPIVGNACEHFSAVRMAIVDKLDITIGIAVGSATQIALFVVPLTVIFGWIIDKPMDLNFKVLDTIVMAASTALTFSILQTAGNWFFGFMMMMAYATIATMYWFFPNADNMMK